MLYILVDAEAEEVVSCALNILGLIHNVQMLLLLLATAVAVAVAVHQLVLLVNPFASFSNPASPFAGHREASRAIGGFGNGEGARRRTCGGLR